MNLLKKFFSVLVFSVFLCTGVRADDVSADCKQYTDCDALAACELYTEVERALSGMNTDYNGAVARAAKSLPNCANYPDKFKNNIDVTVSDTPQVRLTIDWSVVRQRMNETQSGDTTNSGDTAGTDAQPVATTAQSADAELINHIVNQVFGPDNKAQEAFFTALAKAYIAANKADQTARLNDAFVIDFLGKGNNLDKYKSGLIGLTGTDKDTQLGIDVTWDDVLIAISNVLDTATAPRGALVCENNRSWQMGIDLVGWAATIVAAVLTIYSGGAGGVAVASGRAAVGAGLRAAAKGIAKFGGKATAKQVAKKGSKQLARSAIKLGLKKDMRGWAKYKGKGVLKTGVKKYVKAVGANLKTKRAILANAGAAVYLIGGATVASNTTAGTIYGLVESELSKDYVNCQGLDHKEGCYTVCGDGKGTDDLNTKALKPVLGKTYCVNEKDYALYEITSSGGRGKPLRMTQAQWKTIKQKISSSVKDRGNCDYNEDDIDMYVGFFMHDPDTLEASDQTLIIEDIMRLDD